MKEPTIKSRENVAKTKFLTLRTATYEGKDGRDAKWDYVERLGGKRAVIIVAWSKDENQRAQLLLVRQPRIPLGKIVINFPAGLIDEGETPRRAGIRELKEETGYTVKKVVSISQAAPRSSGLTTEASYLMEVLVDAKKTGKQHLERTEDIEYFWKTPEEAYKMTRSKKYIFENDALVYISAMANFKVTLLD